MTYHEPHASHSKELKVCSNSVNSKPTQRKDLPSSIRTIRACACAIRHHSIRSDVPYVQPPPSFFPSPFRPLICPPAPSRSPQLLTSVSLPQVPMFVSCHHPLAPIFIPSPFLCLPILCLTPLAMPSPIYLHSHIPFPKSIARLKEQLTKYQA